MSRIWHRVVRVAAWCAVHAYYRSVRVEGRERLPATGPVLLVCNHPNSLLDPAVLLVVVRRPVRFAVKAPLFRVPVLGMILRGIGAVPIERPDDAGADVRRNVGALAGLTAALRSGAACGFFPEGFTHTDPRLHVVRSGPARIAVDAEASANGALGLRVVPVGLSFHPQQAFRGEVVVRVGQPFGVADLGGTNRHVAVRTVQARIAAGLRPVVHHVGRAELAALVERVATLHVERATAGRRTAPRETDVHVLGAALDVCSVADPVALDALDALADRHDRLSGRTGVEGSAVGLSARPARALTLFLLTSLGLVAGFPLFLAGLLTGYVPYRLTASTAGRAARREGAAAVPFLRVVLGAWWFGLYWGLVAWLVFAWSESAGVTAVFVASMAATGLFALGYASRAVRWETRLEALAPFAFRRRAVARVAEARDAVVAAATEIVERHGPDGGAAAWRAEREGPPVRRRVPWLRVGAIAAAGASAWFLAGFRATAMEELPDVASPWAAVPPAAAGPVLERDAVSLAACLDALESLDTRMRATMAEFAAGKRDFHDPATDALVRGQFLSYLTCRERLLRLVWYYRDAQTSPPGPQSDRAFVVSYAATIELFARGMQLVEAFDGHRFAVAKLNEGDPSWGIPPGVYDRIRRNLADARALDAMTAATSRFVALRDAGSLPTGGAWLRIVERAAAGADVASVLAAKHWHYAWDAAVARAVGHADEGYYAASTAISTWIGDTRIRARPDNRGLVTPEQLESVRARLLPGDIILERRNWYLSNAFLPGYWPHATLYVGGEDGIAQLGIAADPRVAPHLAAIRAPDHEGRRRVILEAISEGVVFTSLEESIGGADAICVLRPRLPRARCAEAVAKGIRHAGKPYDFEFDFFSTDRLVCSEVVYQAYTEDLQFPLVEIVGRKTLPPIEFVRMWTTERGRPDARFDLVAFLDADEEAGVAVERAADDLPATLDRPGMTLLQQRPDRTPLFLTAPVAALVALLSAALTIRVWRRTALRRASRA